MLAEGHFDTKKASFLDNEERLKELRPQQLLRDIAGITKGMTCVDLGCGTGTFSFPMVRCVGGEGIVYAVDDSTKMLEHMRVKNPPPNLELIHRDVEETGLSSEIADFCLLAFILHEVEQPHRLIAEALRLLKPGGKITAVEWKAELDSPGPPRRKRLTRAHLEELFRQLGFYGFKYLDWSLNHYAASVTKGNPA